MARGVYLFSSRELEEIRKIEESMLLIFSMEKPTNDNLKLYKQLSLRWEKLTGWKSY